MQHLHCNAWPPIKLQAGTHNMNRRRTACGGKHCTDLVWHTTRQSHRAMATAGNAQAACAAERGCCRIFMT